MLLSVLAVSFLLAARAMATVEVVEVTSLPGCCISLFRVAGEKGSVDLAEVRAECAWLERQFPGLQARVLVFPRPVEASGPYWEEQGYRAPDGRPVAGRRVGGAVSRELPEACVFSSCGMDAFVTAHELGHLAWFQLLSPGRRAEYVSLRGLQGKPDWYVWECFAEDFRVAFGSRWARCLDHLFLAEGPPAEFTGLFAEVREPVSRLKWVVSDGRVDVLVEERQVSFPDVQPWVDPEGRVWAPVRFVVEKLGQIVWYDPWTERAFVGSLEFDLRSSSGPGGLEFVLRDGRVCCPLEGLVHLVGGG